MTIKFDSLQLIMIGLYFIAGCYIIAEAIKSLKKDETNEEEANMRTVDGKVVIGEITLDQFLTGMEDELLWNEENLFRYLSTEESMHGRHKHIKKLLKNIRAHDLMNFGVERGEDFTFFYITIKFDAEYNEWFNRYVIGTGKYIKMNKDKTVFLNPEGVTDNIIPYIRQYDNDEYFRFDINYDKNIVKIVLRVKN